MAASRDELATLAREYLLCGHLIDRAAMGYLIGPYGLDGMRDIAIDEWMGASPVYTARMQELMGFVGDDVATIFKGMQFDIGAPHEFLDFRFTVHDPSHGEFRLDHCGALMDVEPMGEDFVVAMCHDIEDPTFDATACATNPRAQVRPVHRPPRVPADRYPHCAWTVEIVEEADPVQEAAITKELRGTAAARLPLPTVEPGEEREAAGPVRSGLDDYSGELIDPMALEAFSSVALSAIIDEVCLQGHLLAMSFMLAVQRRHGEVAARSVGEHQLTGIAGLAAERLVRAGVGADRSGPSAVAAVMEAHPLLAPRSYVDARVDVDSDGVTVSLRDCPATAESVPSWIGLLLGGADRALQAIAQVIDARATCERVDPPEGTAACWRVSIGQQELPEQPEVGVARLSTGSSFRFAGPSEIPVSLR